MEYKFEVDETDFGHRFEYIPFGTFNSERKIHSSPKWIPTYFPNENTFIYVFKITSNDKMDIGEFRFCDSLDDVNSKYICIGFGGWNNTKSVIGYCNHSIIQQRLMLTNLPTKPMSKKMKRLKQRQTRDDTETDIYVPEVCIKNITDIYWFKFVKENDIITCSIGIGSLEPVYVYKIKSTLIPNIVCIGGWHTKLIIEMIDTKKHSTFENVFQRNKPEQSNELNQMKIVQKIESVESIANIQKVNKVNKVDKVDKVDMINKVDKVEKINKSIETDEIDFNKYHIEIESITSQLLEMKDTIKQLTSQIETMKKLKLIDEQNIKNDVDLLYERVRQEMKDEINKSVEQNKSEFYKVITERNETMMEFVEETVELKVEDTKHKLIEDYETKIKNKVTASYDYLEKKYRTAIEEDMESYKNTLRFNSLDLLDKQMRTMNNEMKAMIETRMKEIETNFINEESAKLTSEMKTNIRKYKMSITEQVSNDLATFKSALEKKVIANMKTISNGVMEESEKQMSNDMSTIIEETVNIARTNLKDMINEIYLEIRNDIYKELFQQMNQQKETMIGTTKIDMSKKHIEMMNEFKERYTKMKDTITNDIDDDIDNFKNRLLNERKQHMIRLNQLMEDNYNQLLIDVKMKIADNEQLSSEKQYQLETIANESMEKFKKDMNEMGTIFTGYGKDVMKEKEMYSPINQYFDRVYVINLDERKDRMGNIDELLSKHNILYKRITAFNGRAEKARVPRQFHNQLAEYGYNQSMKLVMTDAQLNNYERILVFDDDVIFYQTFNINFMNAIKNIPSKWKLLYLGASQHDWDGIEYDDTKFYYNCVKTDGSFALGVHRSLYKEIIDCIDKNKLPFDGTALRFIQGKYNEDCIVLKPNLVIADVTESDIRGKRDMHEMATKFKWNLNSYIK